MGDRDYSRYELMTNRAERPFSEQLGNQLGLTENTSISPPATEDGPSSLSWTTMGVWCVGDTAQVFVRVGPQRERACMRITFTEWDILTAVSSALPVTTSSLCLQAGAEMFTNPEKLGPAFAAWWAKGKKGLLSE